MAEYDNSWAYDQANDTALFSAEPLYAEVVSALEVAKSDPADGHRRTLSLAQAGSVQAMINVAWNFDEGRGVIPDPAAAEQWYRRAFEGGSRYALLAYAAKLHARGAFDGAEAVLRVGAADKFAPAMGRLAALLIKRSRRRATFAEALPLLEAASDGGSELARRHLIHHMALGRFGLRRIPEGFRLMQQFGGPLMAKLREERAPYL